MTTTISPLDFPAVNGGVVTEAHAALCHERGHAAHTVDGKASPVCPRCGDWRTASKLTGKMISTLIAVANQGSDLVWGRDKATAVALDKRGLVKVVHCVRSEGTGDALRVEITDAGFELAVELV
jgi:hypothetical protein